MGRRETAEMRTSPLSRMVGTGQLMVNEFLRLLGGGVMEGGGQRLEHNLHVLYMLECRLLGVHSRGNCALCEMFVGFSTSG